MKKLFSLFAVFAFVLTGGVLLAACGGPTKYAVHLPDNLEEYGIEHIYADVDSTGNCVISNESKNIYFRFMPRYDYDPDALIVNFQNSAGQDVEVSNFEVYSYDDGTYQRTYYVTVDQPQEITISIIGYAKIETRIFKIDPTLDDEQVSAQDKLNLKLNIQVGDQSTGDLTYAQFETMLSEGTNGNRLVLLPSQEVDYGTQIKITIWSTEYLSFFEEALLIVDDQGGAQSGLEVEGYEIASSYGTVLKCTSTFTLEENRTLKFALHKDHFENATFSNTNRLRPGYMHCQDQALHTAFEIVDSQGEKITALRDFLKQQTVSLQIEANEFVDIGYIAQCVKEKKFDQFGIVVDGREVSGFTVRVEKRTAEGNSTIYTLIFENVPIKYAVGSKLPGNSNVELFKVVWKDYQAAMNADFVVLPKYFEHGQGLDDEAGYYEYINGGNEQPFNNAYFPVNADRDDISYVLKTDDVEYVLFLTQNAIGHTFKITVGQNSQEITISDQLQEFKFNDNKLTLTYNPNPDSNLGLEEGISVLSLSGIAADFASNVKIELVA